jgi:predicted nucleic acid-binding protein
MKYVLDSNVALKWVLAETDSDKALLLRDDFRNGIHELLSPDFFPAEVGHALIKAERTQVQTGGTRIAPGEASLFWADIMATPPRLYPCGPLYLRALAVASQTRAGLYDCLYVMLTEQEKCEFVTADDRLVKNLGPQFPFIVSLASLP